MSILPCLYYACISFLFVEIFCVQLFLQLSSALKDREKSWKKQKSELENHYTKLIDDLHSRTQVDLLHNIMIDDLHSRTEVDLLCYIIMSVDRVLNLPVVM